MPSNMRQKSRQNITPIFGLYAFLFMVRKFVKILHQFLDCNRRTKKNERGSIPSEYYPRGPDVNFFRGGLYLGD